MVLKTVRVRDTMSTLNRRYSFNAADLTRKSTAFSQTVAVADLPRRNSLTAVDFSKPAVKPDHKWWHFITDSKLIKNHHSASTVAIQKLRESKWFKADEERLFCAVIEAGFIVEVANDSHPEGKPWYGIVSVENKKNKTKPTSNDIFIYTVNRDNQHIKIVKITVADVWKQDNKIRINNFSDRNKPTNTEKDIKRQITHALKTKMNFHNSLHFVEYCRYGEKIEIRKRQVSESMKWGTIGMNAGLFLVMQREKSHSIGH